MIINVFASDENARHLRAIRAALKARGLRVTNQAIINHLLENGWAAWRERDVRPDLAIAELFSAQAVEATGKRGHCHSRMCTNEGSRCACTCGPCQHICSQARAEPGYVEP